jgi:hypothetical protein
MFEVEGVPMFVSLLITSGLKIVICSMVFVDFYNYLRKEETGCSMFLSGMLRGKDDEEKIIEGVFSFLYF